MSRFSIKFPSRVRIHGGEFDESARAIHREDGVKTIQAESGIVLESTIERKQMSTKTTFKRIALVTVAALGFGVMSVAPSNAAAPAGFTATLSAGTTTIMLGDKAKTTLTVGGYFQTADTVTSVAAIATFPATATSAQVTSAATVTVTAVDTATANTLTTSNGQVEQTTDGKIAINSASAGVASGRTTLSVQPTAVGTYTYTVTSSNNGTPVVTLTNTWTVVVTDLVLASSTVFIGATTGTLTADSTTLISASATAATAAVARIQTIQYRDAVPTAVQNLYAKSVVVTITGAGALGDADSTAARGPSVSKLAGLTSTTATNNFYVFADGRSGKAIVTVTIDGVLAATKSFTFLGTMTSIALTAAKTNIGIGEAGTLTAAGADVNANVTAVPTVTATSSDVTVATAAVTATGVVTVTGVKAGTATITVADSTVTTITKTAVVTVLPIVPATVALSFDKQEYAAGEKMTLSITSTGVADGARTVFTAVPGVNFAIAGGSDALVANPTFKVGVATYTLYAPATSGTFTVTATISTNVATELAISTAAGAAYVGTKASLSVTITNPAQVAAQEATDAANEATDAGNNAKDAADQAIEAADAATIAAQDATMAAEAAGEMAVAAAEAAGAIAQDALDAANAATDAALSAAEAADAATAAAEAATAAAEAATAAVAALATQVAKLMAALNAKITTLSNLVAKIAKKVKA